MNTRDETRLDDSRMQSHRDPAQLEHEIDQQRRHIEQLVGALESRLSPSELFDRLLGAGKGGGRDFAGNLMDTLKANPVPALLTAAGMLWLYSGRDRDPSAHDALSGGMGRSTSGSTPGATGLDTMTGADGGAVDAAKDKLGAAKEKVADAKDAAKDKVVDAKDRVAESAHGAADAVRERTHQGMQWLQQMLEQNPLAVAAMAVGVGALLGSLLPETHKENELMGQASDRVTDKLKDLAQTGTERLAETAQEVTRPQAGADEGMHGSSGMKGGQAGAGMGAGTSTDLGTSTGGGGYTPSRPH